MAAPTASQQLLRAAFSRRGFQLPADDAGSPVGAKLAALMTSSNDAAAGSTKAADGLARQFEAYAMARLPFTSIVCRRRFSRRRKSESNRALSFLRSPSVALLLLVLRFLLPQAPMREHDNTERRKASKDWIMVRFTEEDALTFLLLSRLHQTKSKKNQIKTLQSTAASPPRSSPRRWSRPSRGRPRRRR